MGLHLLPPFPHSSTFPPPDIIQHSDFLPQCHSLEIISPSPYTLGLTVCSQWTVWGCGSALHWKWWTNPSLSQPKPAQWWIKWHKYGYSDNSCLGMRGSAVVLTGYSHLLPWENANGDLISARPHSICGASLYLCGSEVCTAGKF